MRFHEKEVRDMGRTTDDDVTGPEVYPLDARGSASHLAHFLFVKADGQTVSGTQ